VAKLGIDIGGTFTDCVAVDLATGQLLTAKTFTTPGDPVSGVFKGLERLCRDHSLSLERMQVVVHATTLATNALIERKGARTALLTTQGFRDIVEIGTERSYDIYDLFIEMPSPLVPRHLRREVPERLDQTGQVVTPLDEASTAHILDELQQDRVESIAICLLHSYRNPVHERRVAELVQQRLPGVTVSVSAEVLPEIREYPRMSTTVVNAYVQPVIQRYLGRLLRELRARGFQGNFYVMLSNGGIGTVGTASRFPVRIVESGPAAGAIAARAWGGLAGRRHVLSLDMGGTTAKTCLIEDGNITQTANFEVARVYWYKKGSGIPIRVPVVDLIEIGAGGGSIARVDALGFLSVGPESAGASPGPVCYGLGGTRPTVTDADLLLGYLDPDFFLGGEMRLDKEAAWNAVAREVADPLGIDPVKAAWGIHDLVNENMAASARIHLVERGRDARRYSLVAFGGAGPVHACGVAEKLRLAEVIFPPLAGLGSACGIIWAPIAFDLVRSHPANLDDLDWEAVNLVLAEMEREGRQLLADAGVEGDAATCLRSCDMRYRGQGYEIEVPIPSGALDVTHLPALRDAFSREYARLFGRTLGDLAIECLNWRVRVVGPSPEVRPAQSRAAGDARAAVKGFRPAYFPAAGGYVDCPVYDRYRLPAGTRFTGPAIVEERESTVVVGPGAMVEVQAHNLLDVRLPQDSSPRLTDLWPSPTSARER